MKIIDTLKARYQWKILAETKKSNAASMTLKRGKSTGGPDNKHPADQWLFVLSGRGVAIISKKKISMRHLMTNRRFIFLHHDGSLRSF